VDALALDSPPVVTRLEHAPDLGALLSRLGGRGDLVALDSAAGEPCRHSLVAFDPAFRVPIGLAPAELPAWLERHAVVPAEGVPGPFAGGFLGALAYDAGVPGEDQVLPADPWGGAGVVGGVYTDFFVLDHRAGEAWLVTRAGRDRAPLVALADAAAREGALRDELVVEGGLVRRVSPLMHRVRIERCREAIARGELYQANLAHPFEARVSGDPLELYLRLREVNPAPYMAYLRHGDRAILSASPELLLEVAADGELVARPIKGTAPRSSREEEDAALAAALLESEKDRAELAMIVDLLRNDLGRVASLGSVRVEGFPSLRSYAGVHHLMADVRARLAPGRSAVDALLAAFPGGSITGAPKLAAMEWIARLEREGRGFFTGSAGFLDARGGAAFNILIRTLEWRAEPGLGPRGGRVRFLVGGGITFASDAAEEDRETLVKGARLARALGLELGEDLP
jgi:para-aminobenzoate synthetase component 1